MKRRMRSRATRRGVYAGLVAVACVAVVSACFPSDPFGQSPDIALAMDTDGRLLVLGNLCGGGPLKSIDTGSGNVPGVNSERIYTPADPTALHVELALGEPQPGFTLSSGDLAQIPEAPLWVMVELEDGVWATASFESLPQPGQAISAPYSDVRAPQIVQPIGDYPTASPDCG